MGWTNLLPESGIYPDLMLEWAPSSLPLAPAPTWVDITSRLIEFEWEYGRNDELAEFEPGHGYVVLDNEDRAFDPGFAASPWFGQIKPRKLFRLRARWAGVEYPLFLAHARGLPQAYPGGVQKRVRIELADVLALLRAVDLDALGFNRPRELSSERLDAILDEAGIPDDQKDISGGTVEVTATADQSEDLGSALDQSKQVVEDSEGWPLYVTKAGKVAMI